MPANMLGEQAFRQQFKAMVGQGCPNCTHKCSQRLKPALSTILAYRKSFSDLPHAAQDRDLLWVFISSVHDHEHQAVSEEHSDMEHTCPTPTSLSSAAPAPPKSDAPKAK